MKAHLLLSLLLGALVFVLSSNAAAQPDLDAQRERARPIALEGFELLQAGRYNEAIAKLEEAERIFHAPTHLLFIGRARRELGELLTAYDTFIDILIEDIPNYAPEQFQKARSDAQQEADTLRAKIATLVIEVTGVPLDRVTVSIDGTPVPSKRLAHPVGVTAGAHKVQASADGAKPALESVEGIVGESTEVSLTLTSDEAGSARPDTTSERSFPVLATLMLAVGGGALIAGAVTGVMTLSKAGEIKDGCPNNVCALEDQQEADDAKLLGNVSTAMFVIGGVLAATGIVLLIVDPFNDPEPDEPTTALGLRVSPTGAALVGTF